MITKIYPADYSHIDSITIDGVKIESSYNRNYYINKKDKSIIYEDCNDDSDYYYDQVFIANGKKTHKYIGCDYGNTSIFERDENDEFIKSDDFGYYAELDTDIC